MLQKHIHCNCVTWVSLRLISWKILLFVQQLVQPTTKVIPEVRITASLWVESNGHSWWFPSQRAVMTHYAILTSSFHVKKLCMNIYSYASMYLSFNNNLELMKNTTYIENVFSLMQLHIFSFSQKGYCSLCNENIPFCLKKGCFIRPQNQWFTNVCLFPFRSSDITDSVSIY